MWTCWGAKIMMRATTPMARRKQSMTAPGIRATNSTNASRDPKSYDRITGTRVAGASDELELFDLESSDRVIEDDE